MTSRPSSIAPRASTCAASCTPWPPMPVMSSSRSIVHLDSGEAELHQVLHLAVGRAGGAATSASCMRAIVEIVDELGVAVVAAERVHRGSDEIEQLACGSPRPPRGSGRRAGCR